MSPLPDFPDGADDIVTALVANSWLKRLFGPSVDAVGDSLKRWTEDRLANVKRVAETADQRRLTAGSTGDSLPLRVATTLFDQATLADDPIIADYLGGVLASSWSEQGDDDRAVTWSAQVARMSSDMLRVHYVCYEMLRRSLVENHARDGRVVRQNTYLARHKLVLPTLFFAHAELGGDASDDEKWSWLLDRAGAALLSLEHERLIAEFESGPLESFGDRLTQRFEEFYELEGDYSGYLVTGFTPTAHGIRLFLVAHGLGRGRLDQFVNDQWPDEPIAPEIFNITEGESGMLRSEPCCVMPDPAAA